MNQTYLRSEDMEIQKIKLLYAEGEEVSRAAKNQKMITASASFFFHRLFLIRMHLFTRTFSPPARIKRFPYLCSGESVPAAAARSPVPVPVPVRRSFAGVSFVFRVPVCVLHRRNTIIWPF